MTHTPGPWVVNDKHRDTAYGDVDSVIEGDGKTIAHIFGGRELQPRLTALTTFAEARANANLIAAAPETAAERDRLREALRAQDKSLANVALSEENDQLIADIARLHEVNKELVEALKMITYECDAVGSPSNGAVDKARAAIVKAEGREREK